MRKVIIVLLFSGLLSGCGPMKGIEARANRKRLDDLNIGMTTSNVRDVMGKPYKRELYGKKEVWFYITVWQADGYTNWDEMTPLVFEEDTLLGWGQNFFRGTLQNDGSEVSDSDTTQSQGPTNSATSDPPEPKTYTRESKRDVLAGLQGVEVVVEHFGSDENKYGFNIQQYETDVELRLRQYGVKVLSREESAKTAGSPYLYINVNPVINEKVGIASVGISVQLKENVFLERNPSATTFATTWKQSGTLLLGLNRLDSTRDDVRDAVDIFINDYLAANPKDQPSKEIQQRYVVPKNALIDMQVCPYLLVMAYEPNLPQEQKVIAVQNSFALGKIQALHLLQLGIKPEDIAARMSILTKGDIKDMPAEVFDYVNFEDYKKMSP